ncbi:hypothetical protein B5M47_01280 [candidate division CPR3 bacterium 4484_211]|uniref:tRNA carboxymethyluridine synthase n=1 Tax=candidate division CPR3 bacterium 4484_211 TaxID=1968527 RepID=A0A1W9NZ97_UNCC3|nr:MAG: hypothetical protein B5M47_01280 [candidate division CPR3 bacterium 4484_211]
MPITTQLLKQILTQKASSKEDLRKIKRKFSREHKIPLIKNSDLLAEYWRQVNRGSIKRDYFLEDLLQLKSTRTLSGVSPVAIFTKPYPCPGKCIYCPTKSNVPKSYLPNEPAVMRAELNQYDPILQIKNRLQQYKNIGHPTDKIDLIIKGGTWSAYPVSYRKYFIKQCYAACNNKLQPAQEHTSLFKIQKINETAQHRLIGINIETRPDLINEEEIKRLRNFGVTRVELGVQTLDDKILKLVRRGHGVKDTIRATRLLKEAGFKVGYHMMPGLPGSNPQKDVEMFKQLFTDPRFQPDMLKIYPCVITKNTQLYTWYKQGKYTPYNDRELIELLIEIKKILPPYVRVDRIGRDIPAPDIMAGSKISNIRQVVQKRMKEQELSCQCIRCREIREHSKKIISPTLKKITYPASGGREYFLSFVSTVPSSRGKVLTRNLLALLRLRFTTDNKAIIRELHTYGVSIKIGITPRRGTTFKKGVQHRGLGKKLLEAAENIVNKKGVNKIAVISGVGVREYYRKLGYKLEGTYMVKKLGD